MLPDQMAAIHAASFTCPRPWSAAEITALLDSRFCFAISRDQGFLIGRCIADEAELLTMAVAPEARRGGLGADLVAAFLREASTRGAAQAFLEVASDNPTAQRLYTRAGFAVTGQRRGYYAPGIDAVLMGITLPA